MNRKKELRSRYRWQISCLDGSIYDENLLNSPSDIGNVWKIQLIPQYYGLEVESMDIPTGATPVFYFTCKEQLGGQFESITFHIGYEKDGERVLIHKEVK